jgi:hypothetical protein
MWSARSLLPFGGINYIHLPGLENQAREESNLGMK